MQFAEDTEERLGEIERYLREVGIDQVQKVVSRTRSSSEAEDWVVELLTKAIILP